MRKSHAKSTDFICRVCGAPAIGYNFSVITCMCCKAFFRRNALLGLEAYQCRYSTENCSISIRTRRDCSYCRLKKCFLVGMKKELIHNNEIKCKQQLTVKSNQNSIDIFVDLRNIFNAYEQYCRLPIRTYEQREYEMSFHLPIKNRIKFQHYLEIYHVHCSSLENFFKHIPELQQFNDDEQKYLMAHNIRFLMRMNSIETMNDSFPLWGPVHLLLKIMYGQSLIERVNICLHQCKIFFNESYCTQILLIILLFSTTITYNGHLNTLILYEIQEKYIRILWIYLVQRYGELSACQKFSSIIRQCLHLQILSHRLELKRENSQWQKLMIHKLNPSE